MRTINEFIYPKEKYIEHDPEKNYRDVCNLINSQTAGALGAAILTAKTSGYFKSETEAFLSMEGKPIVVEPAKRGNRNV